jgi:CheY-like chemotaxis protein
VASRPGRPGRARRICRLLQLTSAVGLAGPGGRAKRLTHPRAPAAASSVLIIEDHRDTAATLALFLQLGCGCRVRVAPDGQAGVEEALRDPPSAIICDIGLPKKDGFQVAAEVAGALPRKPLLIAVSGYAEDEYIDRARAAGFDEYLVKPADPFAVAELLRTRAGGR